MIGYIDEAVMMAQAALDEMRNHYPAARQMLSMRLAILPHTIEGECLGPLIRDAIAHLDEVYAPAPARGIVAGAEGFALCG